MRPERLDPSEILEHFREWKAVRRARVEFSSWATKHRTEMEILNILEIESGHRPPRENPRGAKIFESAQQLRRELGFSDHLVPYVYEDPFALEEALARDEVVLSEEEQRLLEEVNYGFWAQSGNFTGGVRHPVRFE